MRFRAAIPASEIVELCRPFLAGGFDAANFPATLSSLDSPEYSAHESLTFLDAGAVSSLCAGLRAALVVCEGDASFGEAIPYLRVRSVRAVMAALLQALGDRFARPKPFVAGEGNRVHPTATVEGFLEGDVTVGAGAYVGRESYVGFGTRIEPHAVILEGCVVGRRCVIQPGAVLGCAGFGFFESEDENGTGLIPMPHLAGVEIGDDCWIGANAVIAAGVLHPTSLGHGCKLDSHVQIAHNVRLGDGCLLASQSGIAGSTRAGNHLRMGGAASMDGHLRIGDRVTVAACSGVTKDMPDDAVVAGFPARPIREWRRQQVLLKKMAERENGEP